MFQIRTIFALYVVFKFVLKRFDVSCYFMEPVMFLKNDPHKFFFNQA